MQEFDPVAPQHGGCFFGSVPRVRQPRSQERQIANRVQFVGHVRPTPSAVKIGAQPHMQRIAGNLAHMVDMRYQLGQRGFRLIISRGPTRAQPERIRRDAHHPTALHQPPDRLVSQVALIVWLAQKRPAVGMRRRQGTFITVNGLQGRAFVHMREIQCKTQASHHLQQFKPLAGKALAAPAAAAEPRTARGPHRTHQAHALLIPFFQFARSTQAFRVFHQQGQPHRVSRRLGFLAVLAPRRHPGRWFAPCRQHMFQVVSG